MNRIPKAGALALAVFTIIQAAPVAAAPFTPGNLVVVRVGTGAAALTNASTAVFLDEYTTAGTLIQSVPLPTAASGANQPFTLSGTATSEGLMTRSADGRYLVLAGYGIVPGTASVGGTATATTNRVAARIDADANIDTRTAFNTLAFSGNSPRGAATVDGTNIWVSGTASVAANGGIWHQTFSEADAGTQVSATFTNLRGTGVFGGQLYVTSGGGTLRLGTVGTGTPITAGETTTSLPGLPVSGISPNGFVLLDRDGAPGIDTIYMSDDTNASVGIRKYSFEAGTWTDRGTVGPQIRGLTGFVSGGNAVIYGTTNQTAANNLVVLTDTAAFNAPIAGTQATIATAATNTVFRGVAFAPENIVVTPQLSIAATSVNEGDTGCVGGTSTLAFTVTANPAPTSQLTFNFDTTAGTATAGTDYTEVVDGTGTIAANATTGTASVTVSCDNLIEASETLTATLDTGAGYTISPGGASAVGTITNDDIAEIRIADVDAFEGNSGTSVFQIAVTLDNNKLAPAGGITIDYVVQESDAPTATDGVDFLSPVPEPGTITIGAGTNGTNVPVTVNGDATVEPDENFAVVLSNPSSGTIVDGTSDSVIQNDDAVTPVLSINDVTVTEGDTGGPAVNAVFTVSIAPAPAGTVTVDATTAGDSATSGTDFTANTQSLSFDGANLTRTFTVAITNDCDIEGAETFFVNLSNVSGGATIGDGQGVGTIGNNDVAVNAAIAFDTPNANEGDVGTNTRTFRVTLDRPMQCGAFTFAVANTGGTATAGTDYNAVSISGQSLSGATTSASFDLTVIGDLPTEADETIELTLSGSGTNVTINPSVATATLVNDDTAPVRTIAEIQGDAFQSPFNNTVATVFDKVVTAVLPNGFFMSDRTPDGQLDTSDSMFVFTSTAPTVAVGDTLDVRGTILEAAVTVPAGQPNYSNLTKFTSTGLILNPRTSGAALPAPFVLDDAMPSPSNDALFCVVAGGTFTPADFNTTKNFECLEGMRVTTSTGMVNGPVQVFASDPLAEQTITTSGRRALREAGLTATQGNEDIGIVNPSINPDAPPLPALRFDGNPEGLEIDMDRLGLPFQALVPGTTFTATGILAFEFGGYELFPSAFSINQAAPALPAPVDAGGSDQLTVASQNALRFYDRCDDPTRPNADEVVDLPRVDTKLDKLSRQVREVLRSPDIIAFQEVEQASPAGTTCANGQPADNALQLLAAKILADGGPAYTAFMPALTNDPGFINNGFLVNTARFNVTNGPLLTQWQPAETWTFNGSAQGELHDRPSLLLEGTTTFGAQRTFAIVNNHLRSLSGIDDLSPLADHIDAHRVRQKRLHQAASVACTLQAYQTANTDRPLVLVGDFNAFQFSDGYVDVVGIIRGDANPADAEYNLGFDGVPTLPGCAVTGGQIVAPPLTEAVFSLPTDQHYSFYFQGIGQELDHALMSTAAGNLFEGMQYARGNSDAATAQETVAGTALRSSDHDGFVVRFNAGTDETANGFGIFKDGFE